MIARTLLAAALVVVFPASAFAFHCPTDGKAINAGLAKVTLSADKAAQVMTLRDDGLSLHKAGNHEEAQFKLADAMRIILNNM